MCKTVLNVTHSLLGWNIDNNYTPFYYCGSCKKISIDVYYLYIIIIVA